MSHLQGPPYSNACCHAMPQLSLLRHTSPCCPIVSVNSPTSEPRDHRALFRIAFRTSSSYACRAQDRCTQTLIYCIAQDEMRFKRSKHTSGDGTVPLPTLSLPLTSRHASLSCPLVPRRNSISSIVYTPTSQPLPAKLHKPPGCWNLHASQPCSCSTPKRRCCPSVLPDRAFCRVHAVMAREMPR